MAETVITIVAVVLLLRLYGRELMRPTPMMEDLQDALLAFEVECDRIQREARAAPTEQSRGQG